MILNHIKSIFAVEGLRKKIIAVFVLVLVYKLMAVIAVPWVNTEGLKAIMDEQKWLAFFSALMWGWLENFSIILMWLAPYINAMIIIQLLWVIFTKIWDLQKEWEAWQKIITKWTRLLTLPLAFVQSYGMILLMNSLSNWKQIIDTSDTTALLTAMVIITAWTIFLMWLWEIMTEYGIWNGISIIITAWVLAAVPWVIMWYVNTSNYPMFIWLLFATLLIIYIIIKFTEGTRKIPLIDTKSWVEEKSYFPIRINQAWMVPIIFAISIVTFPWILGQLLQNSTWIAWDIWKFLITNFNMSNPSWISILIYFLLVVWFSFFYVSITFNTENIAENIQKRWQYIPWIRPWEETSNYLSKVSNHLNLFWWWFLAIIAVLPYIMSKLAGQTIDFIISWAWLIIVVSVILDIIRKADSEMKMYDYSKFK